MACPYLPGESLTLRNLDKPETANNIEVEIDEVFPPTSSCAMRVRFSDPSDSNKVGVLKLYDRRFAEEKRAHYAELHNVENYAWNQSIEDAFLLSVRNGSAAKFVRRLPNNRLPTKDEITSFNEVQYEAWLYRDSHEYYTSELAVYKALRELQGDKIPQIYHRVRLLHPSPLPSSAPLSENEKEFIYVYGIIIEYIPGFQLSELHTNLPAAQHLWQRIVDQASRFPRMLSDNHILNIDISDRNVLVTADPTQRSGYRTVMIDFGCCRFRRKHESDLDWGRANYEATEERDIGYYVQPRLRDYAGFRLRLTDPNRWSDFARPPGETEKELEQKRRKMELPEELGGPPENPKSRKRKEKRRCEMM